MWDFARRNCIPKAFFRIAEEFRSLDGTATAPDPAIITDLGPVTRAALTRAKLFIEDDSADSTILRMLNVGRQVLLKGAKGVDTELDPHDFMAFGEYVKYISSNLVKSNATAINNVLRAAEGHTRTIQMLFKMNRLPPGFTTERLTNTEEVLLDGIKDVRRALSNAGAINIPAATEEAEEGVREAAPGVGAVGTLAAAAAGVRAGATSLATKLAESATAWATRALVPEKAVGEAAPVVGAAAVTAGGYYTVLKMLFSKKDNPERDIYSKLSYIGNISTDDGVALRKQQMQNAMAAQGFYDNTPTASSR